MDLSNDASKSSNLIIPKHISRSYNHLYPLCNNFAFFCWNKSHCGEAMPVSGRDLWDFLYCRGPQLHHPINNTLVTRYVLLREPPWMLLVTFCISQVLKPKPSVFNRSLSHFWNFRDKLFPTTNINTMWMDRYQRWKIAEDGVWVGVNPPLMQIKCRQSFRQLKP